MTSEGDKYIGKTLGEAVASVLGPDTPENIAQAILGEYRRARLRFDPLRGPHEGYAVILEELDEAWDEIKANNLPKARKEMLQVAAMALAFLVEVK